MKNIMGACLLKALRAAIQYCDYWVLYIIHYIIYILCKDLHATNLKQRSDKAPYSLSCSHSNGSAVKINNTINMTYYITKGNYKQQACCQWVMLYIIKHFFLFFICPKWKLLIRQQEAGSKTAKELAWQKGLQISLLNVTVTLMFSGKLLRIT